MTNHALLVQDAPAQTFKSVYCFAVHAVAEPDVMPRVLELFAKRNLIPTSWHSIVASDRDGHEELQIDIQIQQLETRVAEHIARCLRQIANVQTVLTSEKGYSNSAIRA
jgi:acetolactate synthase small subunit